MPDNEKNTLAAKVRRTFTSVLPVAENRKGECYSCGACCSLPNPCIFLGHKSDGRSYCEIYILRPLNCRKYPRTDYEHITKDTCGFRFE